MGLMSYKRWRYIDVSGVSWKLQVPLDSRQGTQATSHVASGKSDLYFKLPGKLGIPFRVAAEE